MVKQIRKSYQSDLSDKEWEMVEPHIPKPKTKRGRKREHPLREIINAIFYIVRSGCVWRLLPHDSHHGKLSTTISASGVLKESGNV
jgi:putative transposase